jgi:hypothetical protein
MVVFGNVGKSDGYIASLTVNEKGSSPDLHQAPAEDARCVGEKGEHGHRGRPGSNCDNKA